MEAVTPERYLLIVEDSDEDFESLRRILSKSCDVDVPIARCCDGDEAIDFLHRTGDYTDGTNTNLPATAPSLIVVDLNLPGTDGRELLHHIKQDPQLKVIPVIVLTTSSNPKDIETCYRYGANSYLLKQMNIEQLTQTMCVFLQYWLLISVLPDVSTLEQQQQ